MLWHLIMAIVSIRSRRMGDMNKRVLVAAGLVAFSFGVSRMEWEALALWPSVVAIVSVVLLRSALSGLLIGAMAGGILLAKGNPVLAFTQFFSEHLLPALGSEWNVSVLIFTMLLGGFAALLEKGRGFDAILQGWLAKGRRSGQRVQWSAYFMGLVCFFDGLASSLLTGKSIRPLADRVGVSRAKLAYIVDSTSSAVACVAIMSTWIAYQLSMIREGYTQAGIEGVQPFHIFLASIPRNFYCWFTLILLAVVIRQNWNVGPMAKLEKEAGDQPANTASSSTNEQKVEIHAVWRVVLPLLTLILGLFVGLYWNGVDGDFWPINPSKLKQAYGDAQSNLVLLYSTTLACLVALVFNYRPISQSGAVPSSVFLDGVQRFFTPCLVLLAAWCLSSTLKQLEASAFLTSILSDTLPVQLFPAMVFLLGVLISFTTGTSWGTMGVLMPLALPVAFALSPGSELLVASVTAAVFSGAVFGDHCSPLSDTTIVSSMACDLEPFEHVRTQLPYAVTTAFIATFIGFLPLGMGISPWLCLLVGAILIFLLPAIQQKVGFKKNSNG